MVRKLLSVTKGNISWQGILFFVAMGVCLLPFMNAAIAIVLGIIVAQFIPHPFAALQGKVSHILLQCSVVGLGFGMNAIEAFKVGKEGFGLAIISILFTLVVGKLLGRWMGIEKTTAHLVCAGTAICGGSAIAAISPVIKADNEQLSVSLGVVFLLNASALFIFPLVGHRLGLSQQQFGTWSALAIHDTSSVVGAAGKYGEEALKIATTIKLSRVLWIIPLAVYSSWHFKQGAKRIKIPYFIPAFVLAMLIYTYIPAAQTFSNYIVPVAKTGFLLTLFLIGASLTPASLANIGWKPLLHGTFLWILTSMLTLFIILYVI
ncbi:putative sulfate exporter family transporter [Chitinophaga caeni]|uniref:Putative sulfate exporter family transporter n=1 Tax=Chitinophaga caeni TaxID=2029983 RepID=A0A291R069_9BACT|nr:putative sulfate exporter family transporter [Chitinophaga caeni]ATL49561.1 putative sulfate exporter family transporter [Chitinophaga caeni]